MRFGEKDVVVYTEMRGGGEGFKEIKLKAFMGDRELPQFEHKVEWEKQVEKPSRRRLDYSKRNTIPPSRQ